MAILGPTIDSSIFAPPATDAGPSIVYVGPFRTETSEDETLVRYRMNRGCVAHSLLAAAVGQQGADGRLDIIIRHESSDSPIIVTYGAGEWGGVAQDMEHEQRYEAGESYSVALVNYSRQPSIRLTQLTAALTLDAR